MTYVKIYELTPQDTFKLNGLLKRIEAAQKGISNESLFDIDRNVAVFGTRALELGGQLKERYHSLNFYINPTDEDLGEDIYTVTRIFVD